MIPDPTYEWFEVALKSSEVQSETEQETRTVYTTTLMLTTGSSPLPLHPSSVFPETVIDQEKLTYSDMERISLIVFVACSISLLICKIY